MKHWTFCLLLIAAVLLVSCGGQPDAADTVEAYVQALVNKDADRLATLSCAEWEEEARVEFDSFESVATSLEALDCQTAGQDGETTLVTCSGKIIATYDGENQELDLSGLTYQVVRSGGELTMCGYR